MRTRAGARPAIGVRSSAAPASSVRASNGNAGPPCGDRARVQRSRRACMRARHHRRPSWRCIPNVGPPCRPALRAHHAPVVVPGQAFERMCAGGAERGVEHDAAHVLKPSSESGPPPEVRTHDHDRDDRRSRCVPNEGRLPAREEEDRHPQPAGRGVPRELPGPDRPPQTGPRRVEFDQERAKAGNAGADGIKVRQVGRSRGAAPIVNELAVAGRHGLSLPRIEAHAM